MTASGGLTENFTVTPKYTPRLIRWLRRTSPKEREQFASLLDKVRTGIATSKSGWSRIGRMKRLGNCEVPMYEFGWNIGKKASRIIYYPRRKGPNTIILWIIDVLGKTNFDKEISALAGSVDHQVHSKDLDNLGHRDPNNVIEEMPLDFLVHTGEGTIIGRDKWEELTGKEKSDFHEPSEREYSTILSTFINETARVFSPTGDSSWDKKRVNATFSRAAINRIQPPKYTDHDADELRKWKGDFIEQGIFTPELDLSPEQIDLVNEDFGVFIIEGVAGTGKTTILEERFIRFLYDDPESSVLFLRGSIETLPKDPPPIAGTLRIDCFRHGIMVQVRPQFSRNR